MYAVRTWRGVVTFSTVEERDAWILVWKQDVDITVLGTVSKPSGPRWNDVIRAELESLRRQQHKER